MPPYDAATTSPPPVAPAVDHPPDGLGSETRPVGEDDDSGLDVVPERRKPAPQRRAQPPLPLRAGDEACPTLQHTVAKSVCPLDHDDLVEGRGFEATSTAGRSTRCFGAPKRVAAPAARTTAATRLTSPDRR